VSNLEQEIISRNTLWNDNEGRLFMIRFCLDMVYHVKARPLGPRMLEIGVDRGSVPIFLTSFFIDYGGKYVGVDPKWRVPVDFGEMGDFACFLQADSASFWKVDKRLWDLIFVDGCHDDDVADLDVREAALRLEPNGILLVHDVRDVGGPRSAFIKHCIENPALNGFFATAENVCGTGMGIAFKKGSVWE